MEVEKGNTMDWRTDKNREYGSIFVLDFEFEFGINVIGFGSSIHLFIYYLLFIIYFIVNTLNIVYPFCCFGWWD